MEERLQKIIARAGIASRRHAEEMITSGLVTVNGHTITELGSKADPERDHIKVGGKLIRPEKARVYLILNKPPEVVSTMSDPEGRRSLRDLLQGVTERVFPVGRLEYHAYGLVFLTNDGDLANSILQSHHLPQTYQIKLKSLLTFAEIEELSRATGARISRRGGQNAPWYEVTLAEARRDALRDRLFRSGHPVEKMKRIALANLELGSLPPGQHRELSGGELSGLRLAIKRQGSALAKSPLPKHRPAPKYQPAAKQRPALKQQRPGHSRAERGGAVSSNGGKRGKNGHSSHSSKSSHSPKNRDRSRSKGPRR
jgi:23S rRNA pseudouridine2605 synthase